MIFVREVISKMVDEMKEKCSDNPSLISELKYILKVWENSSLAFIMVAGPKRHSDFRS